MHFNEQFKKISINSRSRVPGSYWRRKPTFSMHFFVFSTKYRTFRQNIQNNNNLSKVNDVKFSTFLEVVWLFKNLNLNCFSVYLFAPNKL